MREKVLEIFNLIYESSNFYLTDNKKINGDKTDVILEYDDDSITIMCNDEQMKIEIDDIEKINFKRINDLVQVEIIIKNQNNLLLSIFMD